MSPEELDEARAKEARRLCENPPYIGDAAYHAARLAREGWTPPEPVDPDVLAFREWESAQWPAYTCPQGAFLAGARMAREQERDRVRPLVDQAKATIDQQARLLDRLPPGMRTQLGIVGVKIMDATSSFYNTLSKYEDGGQ